jgi:hypothetical protein
MRVEDVFYCQLSTVYALLITCAVSTVRQDPTRVHATIAIFIAAPPVSIYFFAYSARAFWGGHWIDSVLGRRKYINRGLVFLAVPVWLAMVILTTVPSTAGRFSQASCLGFTVQEVFIGKGIAKGYSALLDGPTIVLCPTAAIAWAVTIVKVRKEI